jgi:LPXTG-site transpeptidase (sortase) family protein
MRRFYLHTGMFIVASVVFAVLIAMIVRTYSAATVTNRASLNPQLAVPAASATPTAPRSRAALPAIGTPGSESTSNDATDAQDQDTVPETEPTAPAGPLVTRLLIPVIGVDAPVVTKGLDAERTMESPDTPFEVAWYDFTALPGQGSNAVFSGHLDDQDVGQAVFWDLDALSSGDAIRVVLEDGAVREYQVRSVDTYDESSAPVGAIIEPTSVETVTLITCAGSFDPGSARYDQRLIVRAELIPDATP